MSKKLLDRTIPLSLVPASPPGASDRYSRFAAFQDLAAIATRSQPMLQALAGFVINKGRKLGFTKEDQSRLRDRLHTCVSEGTLSEGTLAESVKSLDDLGADYRRIFGNTSTAEEKEQLRHDFCAAICQAIAFKLLTDNGRTAADITQGAHVYKGKKKINGCDIDFVWAAPSQRNAEAYECKTNPNWLLGRYATRHVRGNKSEWEKSQLFLMLEFRRLLTGASWQVKLGCVSLRTREFVQSAIETIGSQPSEVTFYSRDDFGSAFPPTATTSV